MKDELAANTEERHLVHSEHNVFLVLLSETFLSISPVSAEELGVEKITHGEG